MEHGDQTNKPRDLDLIFTLSDVDLTYDASRSPVCTRCDNLGESGDELAIEDGDSVFACACWQEVAGWELFGVYHDEHDVSDIVASNPCKPTALLRGRLEHTGRESNGTHTDTYRLVDLSFVAVEYPNALEQ
jgi:hypothetical protein